MSGELLDTVPFAGDAAGSADVPAPGALGRFVATELLGRGGMGMVLRAHDPVLDRQVALKLLAPERWVDTAASIGAQELAREGQALAKLAHPNVVTVYEMGRIGDRTFIAMELIDGVSLRAWLEAARRPWREVLAVLIACGRGLAAAHAAGLVHRDFKPENVLIGKDGRPRVTDFGLVTTGRAVERGNAVTRDGELLVDGAVVGTPPYMAPEQWLGEAVDARADQFAFCATAWEALSGRRPFPATTAMAIRDQVLAGQIVDDAPGIPRALRPLLRRGLARAREARWPTLDALLARLEAVAAPRRTWAWAAGALTAAGAVTAAVVLARAPATDRCALAAGRVGAAWTPAARAQVDQAFRRLDEVATGVQVARGLDAYAARWAELAGAACRGDRAAGLSPTLRDQRAICLDGAARSLRHVVAALAAADRGVAARSLDAVARLPDLDACDDLPRLGALTAPPGDPALRRRFDQVHARLAEVDALRLAGASPELPAAMMAVVADARALAHPPTLALALRALGLAHRDRRDLAAAEAAFREAASAAADGRDDAAVAQAWIEVLFVASERGGDLAAVAALEPVADAAIRRAGGSRRLRHELSMAAGTLAARRGDFATALARFDAAIETAPDAGERGRAIGDRARVLFTRDGAAAALPGARQSAALMAAALGPQHPSTADALVLVGQAANTAGERTEAQARLREALAIHERSDGRDSARVAGDLVELGNVAVNLGDLAGARAHFEEALAIQRRIGAAAADVAFTQIALAGLLSDTAPAESLPYFDAALPVLATTLGRADLNYLGSAMNHALALRHLGRCDEALRLLGEIDAGLAAYPFVYPLALTYGAQCLRRARQVGPALARLERARAICADNCAPDVVITVDWELGTLLHEAGRDRRRGRAMIEAVVAAARATDPPHPLLPDAEAWLKTHR
ncbi:MAG: serine/threonine protein kinase [Myxococcales bacterium]|nr:serine/threonine protein kinase [Myxococcales bacterium]